MQGLATLTRLEGLESDVSTVSEELRQNEWVHFACHGVPDEEKPLESTFTLHDVQRTKEFRKSRTPDVGAPVLYRPLRQK